MKKLKIFKMKSKELKGGKMEIKEIRKMTGLSQVKFSEKYNVPVRTLQNWEAGKNSPPLYVIELLEFKIMQEFQKENK